jgi:hypothetical protein
MNMVDNNVLSRSLRVQGPLLDDGEGTHANLRYLEEKREIIKVPLYSAADPGSKGTGTLIRNKEFKHF